MQAEEQGQKKFRKGLRHFLKKFQFFRPFQKKMQGLAPLCASLGFFLGKTPLFAPKTWSGAPPRNNVVRPVALETFFFENCWGTAPDNHGGSTPCRLGYTVFLEGTCLHWCGGAHGLVLLDLPVSTSKIEILRTHNGYIAPVPPTNGRLCVRYRLSTFF